MSEPAPTNPAHLADAVRTAIARRREWEMPVLVLRFTDGPAPDAEQGSSYAAVPETQMNLRSWGGRGREYEPVAEFDRDELDELADYSAADLEEYLADLLLW